MKKKQKNEKKFVKKIIKFCEKNQKNVWKKSKKIVKKKNFVKKN